MKKRNCFTTRKEYINKKIIFLFIIIFGVLVLLKTTIDSENTILIYNAKKKYRNYFKIDSKNHYKVEFNLKALEQLEPLPEPNNFISSVTMNEIQHDFFLVKNKEQQYCIRIMPFDVKKRMEVNVIKFTSNYEFISIGHYYIKEENLWNILTKLWYNNGASIDATMFFADQDIIICRILKLVFGKRIYFENK